jgi:hypothetical protein
MTWANTSSCWGRSREDLLGNVYLRTSARGIVICSHDAAWLRTFWTGKTGLWLLSFPVIGQGYLQIGEARVTRAWLGAPVH